MKEKDFDKMFQDKFQDFKVPAPAGAWEAIESSLDKKKKRRLPIFWWSVAAGLAVLLSLGVYYTQGNKFNPEIDIVQSTDESTQKPQTSDKVEESLLPTSEIKVSDQTSETSDADIAHQEATEQSKEIKTASSSRSSYYANESASTATKSSHKAIAGLSPSETSKQHNEVYYDFEEDEDCELEWDEQPSFDFAGLFNLEQANKEETIEVLESLNPDANKEEKNKQSDSSSKWSVGAQIAPMYYNSLSQGSSIDTQFNENSNSGDLNVSMGLQFAYQINDRWQVRSGINQVNLGYNTADINVAYNNSDLALENVVYSNQVPYTPVSDNRLYQLHAEGKGNRIELIDVPNARLSQSIRYIEVPLEIEHQIIQSKFHWSLIGGMSSLFLTQDEISLKGDNFNHKIGSASNLRKTSFSTNIGMGLGYNFSAKWMFRVEPVFKYQLNTYSESVDFKPYMFGVYSGLRWRID